MYPVPDVPSGSWSGHLSGPACQVRRGLCTYALYSLAAAGSSKEEVHGWPSGAAADLGGPVYREPEEERWDPRPATPDLDEPPAEASAGLKGGSEDDTRQVQSAALLLISRCHLAVLLIFSGNLPQVIRLRHHARYAWPVNELVLLAFSHCTSAAVLSVIMHG